jgi:RNA polymerase sigma-70 factor (ECF subfamily)
VFFKKQPIRATFSDTELIDRYKNSGDKTYAGELFQRYSHLVFGVCMKYLKNEEDSRDAVMNIFEKLLVDLIRYKVDYFKTWLHTVSKNHCLMILRASIKNKSIVVENNDLELMELSSSKHLNEESDITEESYSKLDDCFEKLIEEQKVCIQLFYLEEKCYKDVSIQSGFELNKVKSYLQNGRRNLKQCMESTH